MQFIVNKLSLTTTTTNTTAKNKHNLDEFGIFVNENELTISVYLLKLSVLSEKFK